MNSKRYLPNGSMDVRTISPETRTAFERTIVELRHQGKKFSKFVNEQGWNDNMLVAMRQIAKEMVKWGSLIWMPTMKGLITTREYYAQMGLVQALLLTDVVQNAGEPMRKKRL